MGRTGLYELLTLSDDIRKMVMSGAAAGELKELAIQQGMIPMARDGMRKVKDGVSTPSEIMRHAFTLV